MNSYHLRRLWGNTVPILTTNLLESGIIDSKFNNVLTDVAASAFDNFTRANELEVDVPSQSTRRKRRSRTLAQKQSVSPTMRGPDTSTKVTPNDNFFEYQRTRGYRLSTPLISDCDAVRQLEEEFIVDAIAYYLRQFEDHRHMSTAIADTLQSSGIGLNIDLWAAVQKGENAYHNYHVHEGAIVSGVYYSCTPLGCAPLVFKKPGSDSGNDVDDVVIHPKEGQIVLFPPWLSHGVPKANNIDQENGSQLVKPRVSWAFNLNGKIASLGDPWDVTRPAQ